MTAPDGIHVFVDGEDVTDKVIVHDVSPPSRNRSLAFDISPAEDYTVVNGDTLTFRWDGTTDEASAIVVEPLTPLSGTWRVTRGGSIEISPEDWKIIDDFIIDSVAAGHARRM